MIKEKEPLPADGGIVSSKPYAWDSDIVLPKPVADTVDHLLSLAATCHATGIEMRQVWIGLNAEGKGTLIDSTDYPEETLLANVMMMADKTDAVALVMCTEGYTLPPEITKSWAEGRRTHQNVSDHPEHYEVLMVQVETVQGTWAGQAKIIGEAPNQIVRDTLHLEKADAVRGRMNNLLRCNWNENRANILAIATRAQGYYADQGIKTD